MLLLKKFFLFFETPKALFFATGMFIFAIIAFLVGQSACYDFGSYHMYNPYAWLYGRHGYDIATAGAQTFFNPLIHVPTYWLAYHVDPILQRVLLGAFQGLSFGFIAKISYRLCRQQSVILPLFLAMSMMLGSVVSLEIGSTLNDLTVAVFLLMAIDRFIIALHPLPDDKPVSIQRHLLWAGFWVGCMTGLKLTMATYAIGAGVATLLVHGLSLNKKRAFLYFCLTVGAGFLLTNGWWMWFLWQQYGNPFFPNFNDIFKSPFATPIAWQNIFQSLSPRDPITPMAASSAPQSFWQTVLYPFGFTYSLSWSGYGAPFQDFRITVLYVLTIVLILWRSICFFRKKSFLTTYPAPQRLVICWIFLFFGSSYLMWLITVPATRYNIGLEIVTPIALLSLCRFENFKGLLQKKQAHGSILWCLIILGLLILFTGSQWCPRTRSPLQSFLYTKNLHPNRFAEKTILFTHYKASDLNYLIPLFPQSTKFIRLDDPYNFPSPDQDTTFTKLIRENIKTSAKNGSLYAMTKEPFINGEEGIVARISSYVKFDHIQLGECEKFSSALNGALSICKIEIR